MIDVNDHQQGPDCPRYKNLKEKGFNQKGVGRIASHKPCGNHNVSPLICGLQFHPMCNLIIKSFVLVAHAHWCYGKGITQYKPS